MLIMVIVFCLLALVFICWMFNTPKETTTIMNFQIGQHIETSEIYLKPYSITSETREQRYRSGKIVAFHNRHSIGVMVYFRSEQDDEMISLHEGNLQPFTGIVFRGNEKLSDTSVEDIIK